VNNNEPEAVEASVRPLARAVAAGLVSMLAAGWVAPASANVVTEWNAIALGCIPRGGPANALDVSLVQAAVHDAVQAIEKRYEPYFSTPSAVGTESKAAAAAAAAYWVLTDNRVCPDTVQATLDAAFLPYKNINDPGLAVGKAAADALLATEYRADNGAAWGGRIGIGEWRPTPPGNANMAFVYVATARPFVMDSPSQFRPGPAPAVTSDKYTREYNEVKEKGSVQAHPATPGCPAPADTDMARFWGGNIPAQWNQVLRDVAIDRQLGLGDTARLLALGNLAAADAGIAVWDSKLFYNYWRPITAIREVADDGNPNTASDTSWTPFIQSPHLSAQNPAYPDYVSGANGVTGAFTTTLQLFFKSDFVPLAINKAPLAATVPICTNPRLFRRISDAAEEVVEARILLGIHFRSADVVARQLGTRVAWNTFTHALRPLHNNYHGFGYGHGDDDDDHDSHD
jgi:PAP2 superfamily